MGLDTTAVEIATHLPGYVPVMEDGWPDLPDDVAQVFAYASFPHALDGMEGAGKTFTSGKAQFIGGEYYQLSGRYDGLHVSYGGHYHFRAELADAVGLDFEAIVGAKTIEEVEEHYTKRTPFIDLLNFADNEGTLGSLACARLSWDFAKHASARSRLDSRYQGLWDAWRRCVDLAANTGLIDFH